MIWAFAPRRLNKDFTPRPLIGIIKLPYKRCLEDLEEIAEKENATETLKAIAKKRRQLERKLYQKPPLTEN